MLSGAAGVRTPYNLGEYVLSDLTTGATAVGTVDAARSTSNGAACATESLFNTARVTAFAQTCMVTIGGATKGIGDFGTARQPMQFDLRRTLDSSVIQATASAQWDDGSTFFPACVTSLPLWY